MTINITTSKRAENNGVEFKDKLFSTSIINSTIGNLLGSHLRLNVSNVFLLNPSKLTRAVFDLDNSLVSISDSTFKGIHAGGYRNKVTAVLHVINCHIDIKRSHFYFNSAYRSSIYGNQSDITIISSVFVGNRAGFGGCIQATESKLSIFISYFEINHAFHGAAITVENSSMLTVDHCTFKQNSAICRQKNESMDEYLFPGFYRNNTEEGNLGPRWRWGASSESSESGSSSGYYSSGSGSGFYNSSEASGSGFVDSGSGSGLYGPGYNTSAETNESSIPIIYGNLITN